MHITRGRRTWPAVLAGMAVIPAGALFMSGCASEPASQRRIEIRNQSRADTIQGVRDAEARHPAKLQQRLDDNRKYEARKADDYRESRRLAGDRFW